MSAPVITVGSFPYKPGFNPYQTLFTRALESAGLAVVRIPPRKFLPLTRACRQPIDLLHLDWHHDWYRGKNWITQLLKRVMYSQGLRQCRRLPVVWTAHNVMSHDVSDPRLDRRSTQQLIDACRGIVTLSDASQAILRTEFKILPSKRVMTIPHGHYIDYYPNAIDRAAARRQLAIEPHEFAFLSLGSLRRYKGHAELIEAFRSVAGPSDRLVIAGAPTNPSFVADLREQMAAIGPGAAAKVDLHDRMIPEQELQVFFNAADVCVLPFHNILNSGSLLLAISFGKPVVAPAIGSVSEVVRPASFVGYNPAAEGGLAGAMDEARRRFASGGEEAAIIADVRDRFSWDRVGTRLRDLYSELLQYSTKART